MSEKFVQRKFQNRDLIWTNFDSLYVEYLFDRLTMSYNGFKTNDMFGPKPVEVGKEYDVQITELSRKGDGIARIQRFVIFVKNGKVGQNTKIKIIQVGNRFATAEIVSDSESQSQTESAPANADPKTETPTE
jgi:predicted RNA-binding protein with TRAM domain